MRGLQQSIIPEQRLQDIPVGKAASGGTERCIQSSQVLFGVTNQGYRQQQLAALPGTAFPS